MVTLMSVDNIYNDLYPFLVKDWKNTSLLIDKETSQKSFPAVLKKFIRYTYQKSQYAFDIDVLSHYQNTVLVNNNQELFHNVFLNMANRYEDLLTLDLKDFSIHVLDDLSKRTNYINSLKPQGWEQFILANKGKNIDLSKYNEKYSHMRGHAFKGVLFTDDDFGFYDKISLFVTAKKYLERDIPPYISLFKAIAQYVLNYNKKVNTSEYIRAIDHLLEDGITERNLKNDKSLRQFITYEPIKLDFEIIEEKEKKKEDLNNMLRKLTK
jgi:hypothetical protein